MSDDNLYLRSGDAFDSPGAYYPSRPQEQVEEEIEDTGKKAASYPILSDLADWFENEIKQADSIDNIQIDSLTINGVAYERKVHVEAQMLAYQLLKQKLQQKFHEFKEFQETLQ